jgi:glucose-6-phosphate 1-epimerase
MAGLEIPGALQLENDDNGLTRVLIDTGQAQAELFLQGAHLTSWIPAGHRPVLFTSSRSFFAPGKAIRGGIPVIFPWFGPRGGGLPGPMHGYARISQWTLDSTRLRDDGAVELHLSLPPVDALQLSFHLAIGARLEMELEVRNTSAETLTFEEAFHTYLAVSDVRQVLLTGLEGAEYLDKGDNFLRKRRPAEPMRIAQYTDQVHLNTTATCVLEDPGWARRIVVEKSGSATTVVWNPWSDKTPTLADMAPDEWQRMLCVETANAAENAAAVAPGATHRMRSMIRVE